MTGIDARPDAAVAPAAPPVPLVALKDAEYSAFISYAHADDEFWNGWITRFRKELERTLRNAADLRSHAVPPVHLSGQNGPVAGELEEELKQRVAGSFAMVIVVHDNYVLSPWCLKELAYFKARFGEAGCRERLYVLALSEPAIQKVTNQDSWRNLIPAGTPLWMPFFDEQLRDEPVRIYNDNELLSTGFNERFQRMRRHLLERLKSSLLAERAAYGVPIASQGLASVMPDVVLADPSVTPAATAGPAEPAGPAKPAAQPAAPTVAASTEPAPRPLGALSTAAPAVSDPAIAAAVDVPAAAPTPGAPAAAAAPSLVLGFVPNGPIAAASRAAGERLRLSGFEVLELTPAFFMEGLPPLPPGAQLVLPFDSSPLTATHLGPGGHLQVQRDAWLARQLDAATVRWLDLRAAPEPTSVASAASAASAGSAAAYVLSQSVEVLGLEALIQRLKPPPTAAVAPATAGDVKLYIESNRIETNLWKPLGEQMRRRWQAITSGNGAPPLTLRPRGLPVEQIDQYPNLDDADGVVLLWGRKSPEALVAQINKVENKMSAGRDAAPGFVAFLMPPQASADPVPAWGWQVLRFQATQDQPLDVVNEERGDLDAFLRDVLARGRLRLGLAA